MTTRKRLLLAGLVLTAGAASGAGVAAGERPAVSGFSVSPSTFTVAQPPSRPAPASGRGAAIRFRLSKPAARLRIAVARGLAGRRLGGRCVKPTPALRGRRSCRRYAYVGVIKRTNVGRGEGRLLFRGRLNGQGLRPGRYRAGIVAVDGRGRKSARKTDTFTIVRPGGGGAPTPVAGDFPNEATTGVPAGWAPKRTQATDMTVRQANTFVEDVLFTNGASLTIDAPNVTVRRVKFQGGYIRTGDPGVLIEDTTFDRSAPETNGGEAVISYCGYTARRVEILDRSEGFREGCDGPTTIEHSFARIKPTEECLNGSNGDWHGDGVQGYGGQGLRVTMLTIDFQAGNPPGECGGTSPFFYEGKDNPEGHAVINGLLLKGGGFTFRLGTPGSVQGLKIVNRSWGFGPISIDGAGCGAISPWEAKIVEVDANWNITRTVRNQPCRG